MGTRGEDTKDGLRRYWRMACRAARWLCPSVLEIFYGAAAISACPLPPLHLLKADASGAVVALGHLDPAANRPGTPLSPAELHAWEHLVRELSGGTSGNSRGPE